MPSILCIRRESIFTLVLILISAAGLSAAETGAGPWKFFAFDNGVGRDNLQPDEQATILADLGYAGMGYTGVNNIPAVLEALESRGLKMFSTYLRVNLKEGEAPYDPGLPVAIKQMKGHGTALWLHVHGSRSPSDDLDERAVTVIGEIADMAQAAELPVVLYPHTGFYVATMADAVRVVKKIDRDNVRASFNLCHYLKQNGEKELQARLKDAMPYLSLVSINGADSGDTRNMNWDRLIQTLDRGTFDLGPALRQLKDAGYKGPIGLQCYNIRGDIRENLKKSIQAWHKLSARVAD